MEEIPIPAVIEPEKVKKSGWVIEKPINPFISLDMDDPEPAWRKIVTYVDELAAASKENFTTLRVREDLLMGIATLHIGYLVDDIEAYNAKQPCKKEFAGYVIVQVSIRENAYHVWQVYILPKFRNTDLLNFGNDYLEKDAKAEGCKWMSLYALRHEVEALAKQKNYTELGVTYRKSLI